MRYHRQVTSLSLSVALSLVLIGCSGNETAPEHFKVRLETTKGNILVQVEREWSPLGADRFYALVKTGYLNGDRFFRVVPGFIIQFGLNPDPKVTAHWRAENLQDEPVKQSNVRGTLSFAKAGPNSRTTQLFINTNNNDGKSGKTNLDEMGFSPFGRVIDGMGVVDQIYAGYAERPDQTKIQTEGNAYLEKEFPNLDYIKTATVVQ